MRPIRRDERLGRLEEHLRSGLAYAIDERLAPHYERHMVGECGYRTPEMVAASLAEFVGGASSDPVTRASLAAVPRWLDIGAGTGLVGKAARTRGIALDLVALDVSRAMLALIDCPSYVARRCADATLGMPFESGSFDGAIAAGLLEHVTDPKTIFREVARVLKSGGAFVFTFPPRGPGGSEPAGLEEGLLSHDPSAIRAGLESAGLSIVHEVAFPAYLSGPYGWITHQLVLVRKGPATAGGATGSGAG